MCRNTIGVTCQQRRRACRMTSMAATVTGEQPQSPSSFLLGAIVSDLILLYSGSNNIPFVLAAQSCTIIGHTAGTTVESRRRQCHL